MDLSLFFFADDRSGTLDNDVYHLLLEGARTAENHGLKAVWVPERHFHPFGGAYPNPSVLGAALATMTTSLRIRAGSVVAPLHNPIRIAEEWAAVDNISNGRVDVSFASGWHAIDFVVAPDPGIFHTRKDAMVQAIDLVQRLWRGDEVEAKDEAGEIVKIRTFPRPVQPELPIWITSSGSPDTCALAGSLGASLLTHLLGQNLGSLAQKIEVYRSSLDASNRRRDNQTVTLMLHSYLDRSLDESYEVVREPLSRYLRSSFELQMSSAERTDAMSRDRVSPHQVDILVDRAFDRYYNDSGLFGTVDSALEFLQSAAKVGVNEIACLIDFGVPDDKALASVERIGQLQERVREL